MQALVLAAGLLTGAVVTGSAAHAAAISPIWPGPIYLPCWAIQNDEQITISAEYTVVVYGSCFRGSTDYLSVYDVTQGRYLTGTWETVSTDGNGKFSVVVPGAHCYDRVEAIAYDTGWNSYTNQGNWQVTTLSCPPK
jgi:hypothetical protein